MKRRYPIGPEITPEGVHFRVFAPKASQVDVVFADQISFPMTEEEGGYFSCLVPFAKEGSLYRFCLDKMKEFPDPASRYQPQGPHLWSCIVDSHNSQSDWKGITSLKGHTIYEMHVGTFTREGSWEAAKEKLPYLQDLGITLIEMMPLNEFAGGFGWGYDGVGLFAPCHLYGRPENLKEFINRAHDLNLGVILDVVYNHFGACGNYIENFCDDYFVDSETDWGKAINFKRKEIREFFITNALYWLEEYHFDGLRFDAVHAIFDDSSPHILSEIRKVIEKKGYRVVLIAENENQESIVIQPFDVGGYGFNAAWNDDFHHSAHVRLTGRNEGYYQDYKGSLQELLSALKYGYLYQGQFYSLKDNNRGTPPSHVSLDQFIIYLENHDQIASSIRGHHLAYDLDLSLLRALTTCMILSANVPLLFQGQEFGSSTPFVFFSDLEENLKKAIFKGRKKFLSQFSSFNIPENEPYYLDPGNMETFLKCKLKWDELKVRKHHELFCFHRDLLSLRRKDTVFSAPLKVEGALITEDICLIRYYGEERDDRLIVCNVGRDDSQRCAEPLLAPPLGKKWEHCFSSSHPKYGGMGWTNPHEKGSWKILGHSAEVYTVKDIYEDNYNKRS